jgi:serine phosphatase RsbU (regulator of sigma subunit)
VAFLEADGATNLVIGDVVGHDIAAAASMGQLRSLLRGIVIGGSPGPAATLATLDTAITQLDLGTYATVGLARLEQTPEEKQQGVTRLRWASAGHPPPVVIDQDATLSPVPEPVGHLMLGVDRTSTRGEVVVTLRRGSTVVLYTDGLVERPGEDLAVGTARLEQLVTELGGLELEHLCDQLVQKLVHGRPVDDVALVAVRLHRQDVPRRPEAGPTYLPATISAAEDS